MMQPTEDWNRSHTADLRGPPKIWSIFIQRRDGPEPTFGVRGSLPVQPAETRTIWADEFRWLLACPQLPAIHHESLGEKVSVARGEMVEGLRHRHLKEIDCPDCGARLDTRVALTLGAAGLVGIACPNHHGGWMDQDLLRDIRKLLDSAAGTRTSGERG
jgi:hypothetical protein